jgi:hypothetical protein
MITRRPAILLSLMLAACSSVPDAPLPEYVKPSPPTEKAIVTNVPAVVVATKMTGPIEISDVRPTDHGPGRFYVCVRQVNSPPDTRPRYYSVFFDNDLYKGERLSVIMDECETQTYRPLPAAAPAAPSASAKTTTHR